MVEGEDDRAQLPEAHRRGIPPTDVPVGEGLLELLRRQVSHMGNLPLVALADDSYNAGVRVLGIDVPIPPIRLGLCAVPQGRIHS